VGVTGVDLAYSTTGSGGPFTDIALNELNDGVYPWTVPNQPSSNVFVRAIARDAASNTGQDLSDAAFSITAAPALALHVHGLTVQNIQSSGNRWNGRATVTVHDQNHAPAAGVVVTGNWSGAITQNGATGTTNGSGVATVDSQKKKNATGQFCFDVTNLAKSGYTYDMLADVPQTPPAVCGPTIPGAFAVRQLVSVSGGGPTVVIRFRLEEAARVSLAFVDLAGRRVGLAADGPFEAGEHQVTWDARGMAGGIYFYRMDIAGTTVGGKVLLVTR
jgi:hypothetical protein